MTRAANSIKKKYLPVQCGTKKSIAVMQSFLDRLAEGDTIGVACGRCGIGYTTVYEWRREDAVFAEAWDAAVELGIDKFEQEARRRAFEGNERKVFNKDGTETGAIIEYSDRLAEFMLKGRRKKVFAERTEISGPDGGPVQHEIEVTFVKAKDGKKAE